MNKYAFLVSNIITLGPSTPATCLIGELFGSPEAEQDLGSLSQLWELGRITHPRKPPRPPWVPSSSSLTGTRLLSLPTGPPTALPPAYLLPEELSK